MKSLFLIIFILTVIVHLFLYFHIRKKKRYLLSYFEYHISMLIFLNASILFLFEYTWLGFILIYSIVTTLNIMRLIKWLINSNKTNFYFIALYLIESLFIIITLYANLYKSFNKLFSRPNLTSSDALYYSVTTFTTAGYGDIYPTHNITKLLATSEMLVGYFYSAIIISLMVSKFIELKDEYINK